MALTLLTRTGSCHSKYVICSQRKLFKTNILNINPKVLFTTNSTKEVANQQYKQGIGKNNILAAYYSKVYDGIINEDDHQIKIVHSLQRLDDDLKGYMPAYSTSLSPRRVLKYFVPSLVEDDIKPKGLYLWGSVGCGKTFIMDLFYQNCSIDEQYKHRLHFHRFMLDIHSQIHQIKMGKIKNIKHDEQKNPIPTVARLFASKTWLLCLDEFQVTDVADAMILKQLFTYLFEFGVILLATSNRVPDDLYKSGLQRSAFLPFIPMLKKNCYVECLDSQIDYRRVSKNIKKVYFLTSQAGVNESLDSIFKILALSENDIVKPLRFKVNNREVTLKKTCGRIADCDFSELCQVALGPDDYDKIGKIFNTVIIRNIPQLTIKRKSEAKRFITLIDMLYDNRCRVLFSSEVDVESLFKLNADYDELMEHKQESLNLLDDLGLHAGEAKQLNLVTGEEEIFACDRTISRVIEMQTSQYWDMFNTDSDADELEHV